MLRLREGKNIRAEKLDIKISGQSVESGKWSVSPARFNSIREDVFSKINDLLATDYLEAALFSDRCVNPRGTPCLVTGLTHFPMIYRFDRTPCVSSD